MSDFTLEGRGGQAGAFVVCLETDGQVRWTAEVAPDIINEKDRHRALQSSNCIRVMSGEEFAALDPQPLRI